MSSVLNSDSRFTSPFADSVLSAKPFAPSAPGEVLDRFTRAGLPSHLRALDVRDASLLGMALQPPSSAGEDEGDLRPRWRAMQALVPASEAEHLQDAIELHGRLQSAVLLGDLQAIQAALHDGAEPWYGLLLQHSSVFNLPPNKVPHFAEGITPEVLAVLLPAYKKTDAWEKRDMEDKVWRLAARRGGAFMEVVWPVGYKATQEKQQLVAKHAVSMGSDEALQVCRRSDAMLRYALIEAASRCTDVFEKLLGDERIDILWEGEPDALLWEAFSAYVPGNAIVGYHVALKRGELLLSRGATVNPMRLGTPLLCHEFGLRPHAFLRLLYKYGARLGHERPSRYEHDVTLQKILEPEKFTWSKQIAGAWRAVTNLIAGEPQALGGVAS